MTLTSPEKARVSPAVARLLEARPLPVVLPMTLPLLTGHWVGVHDGDPRALALFKRHYSYRHRASGQLRGSPTFVGQGQKMVLLTGDCLALFAWQFSTVPRNSGQMGVNCTVFRNEGPILSSLLIREAMELAWQRWPNQRLFTYVLPRKVRSGLPGACFLAAGWHYVRANGHRVRSKAGHVILEAVA